MPLPNFIRFFANTDESPAAAHALEYLKACVRIAPVRLVSVDSVLAPAWERWDRLRMTPPAGRYINVVCTRPEFWVREMSIPMTTCEWDGERPIPELPDVPQETEVARGDVELYTDRSLDGCIRNVLFATEMPVTEAQRRTAQRYEGIGTNNPQTALDLMQVIGLREDEIFVIPTVVTHHAELRELVLGARTAPAQGAFR